MQASGKVLHQQNIFVTDKAWKIQRRQPWSWFLPSATWCWNQTMNISLQVGFPLSSGKPGLPQEPGAQELCAPSDCPTLCQSNVGREGTHQGLFFTQTSPAGIFSGRLDKDKIYQQLFCFYFQRKTKTKKTKLKGLVNLLKPQQERSSPPALEAAFKLGSCFCPLPELGHWCSLPGLAPTDLPGPWASVQAWPWPVPSLWSNPVISLPCCHLQLLCPLTWSSFSFLSRFTPGTLSVSEASSYDLMSACDMFQLH